ncbi:MAG: cupin domain-containing protein [Deltaproteobacteria bacterium]|nr:cupin domain-containing protein [Deltaproteobacteria bacterium]
MADFDYPEWIQGLPEIDIPLEGVRGWLLQAGDRQAVFFDIEPIGEIPLHTHGAQFGVMLDGEMSLTISGETRRYKKGDSYSIPAGAEHGAVFHTRVRVIDFFDEPARYSPKS